MTSRLISPELPTIEGTHFVDLCDVRSPTRSTARQVDAQVGELVEDAVSSLQALAGRIPAATGVVVNQTISVLQILILTG